MQGFPFSFVFKGNDGGDEGPGVGVSRTLPSRSSRPQANPKVVLGDGQDKGPFTWRW